MALFDNTSFTMLEKGLDAAWLKQKVTLQNIANDSTPHYKAKSVEFSAVLKKKTNSMNGSTDNEDNTIDLAVNIKTERDTNQTLDGNNVDMEKEQVDLADTQYQYNMLLNKVKSDFSMIRSSLQK